MSAVGDNEIYSDLGKSQDTNDFLNETYQNSFEEYDIKQACENLISVYPKCNEQEIKDILENIYEPDDEKKEKYDSVFKNIFNLESSIKRKCKILICYLYNQSTCKKLNIEFLDKTIKPNKKYSEDYLISYFSKMTVDDIVVYFDKHKIKNELMELLNETDIQLNEYKFICINCNTTLIDKIREIFKGYYPMDWIKF